MKTSLEKERQKERKFQIQIVAFISSVTLCKFLNNSLSQLFFFVKIRTYYTHACVCDCYVTSYCNIFFIFWYPVLNISNSRFMYNNCILKINCQFIRVNEHIGKDNINYEDSIDHRSKFIYINFLPNYVLY